MDIPYIKTEGAEFIVPPLEEGYAERLRKHLCNEIDLNTLAAMIPRKLNEEVSKLVKEAVKKHYAAEIKRMVKTSAPQLRKAVLAALKTEAVRIVENAFPDSYY